MKHIHILQTGNTLEAHSTFKGLCEAHDLPYHTLKQGGKDWPRYIWKSDPNFKPILIHKLKVNQKP